MTSFNNFLKIFFIENVSVSAEKQHDLQYIPMNVSEEKKYQSLDSSGAEKSCFIIEHVQNLTPKRKEKEKKRKYYSEDFIREKHALYYNEHAAFIREKKCSYYAKNCDLITEKRQNYRKENSERKNAIFRP